jgi:hypothetical protein
VVRPPLHTARVSPRPHVRHMWYMRDACHAQATLVTLDVLDAALHELVELPSLVVGVALRAARCPLSLSVCLLSAWLSGSMDTCTAHTADSSSPPALQRAMGIPRACTSSPPPLCLSKTALKGASTLARSE